MISALWLGKRVYVWYTGTNGIRMLPRCVNSRERDRTTLEVAGMTDHTPIFYTPTKLNYIKTKARRKRRGILKRLRDEIRRRDGGVCRYCGAIGTALDHVYPFSKGGQDTLDNLVLACMRCNLCAFDRVFADFESKRNWIIGRRGIFDNDPQNNLLALCTDCFHTYRPRVDDATIFLCDDCMKLQNDEERKRRIYERDVTYGI